MVGLADPVLGARPVAYVVLNMAATAAMAPPPTLPPDGARGAAMADELRAWCQDQLSPFKVPAQVHIVERLPVGPTGKVSRRLVGPWTTASGAGGTGPGGNVAGGSVAGKKVVGNKVGAGEAVKAAAP